MSKVIGKCSNQIKKTKINTKGLVAPATANSLLPEESIRAIKKSIFQ